MKLSLKNTILFRFFDPNYLWEAVSPSSLGLVRVAFGILMYFQVKSFDLYFSGYLSKATYLMHYDYFEWLEMLPVDSMPLFFGILYASVALIILGLFYRPAMATLFLGITYCFLLDKGHYNNHYYMLSMLTAWMVITHWNHWLSIDNWIALKVHGKESKAPAILKVLWARRNPDGIPRWHLLVVQLIVFIVYLFGTIAKLNPDWLAGYPMVIWLEQRANWKVFGPLLANDAFAIFISYMGILFDGLVGFILLSSNTRLKVYFLIFLILPFHIINNYIWRIGIFPEVMLSLTVLFFDPALPKRIVYWLKNRIKGQTIPWKKAPSPPVILPIPKSKPLVMGALTLYFLWQFTFPFRVYLYPWPAEWHTYAQNFSWHMMLTDRETAIRLKVVANGQVLGYVHFEDYVTDRQYHKLVKDPPEIVRFSHYIKQQMQEKGGISQPEIYADYWRSINGRPYQMVIDSTVNLCEAPYHRIKIQDWMIPFQNTKKKQKDFNVLSEEETRNLGFFK